MKKLMSTLFVIAAAANLAMAADKPDFSGNWKMDADKSTFGPTPPPTSMTSKIDHKDPDLSIETTSNDQTTTSKYSTDGKETTNQMMGNDVKSTAQWEGKVLVVKSAANFGGADVKLVSKYSLSEDGKTLTQALSISAPQGDFDMNIVLVKQ
ncbi:MAG: hypothetical protein ABSF22_20430 [Bryobacteraceae bacterium]|jgi:hypothetical protein